MLVPVNVETEGDHTAGQIFGTVIALYLRNSQTQIYQMYIKFLAQPSAHNGRKLFQNIERMAGGRTHQITK